MEVLFAVLIVLLAIYALVTLPKAWESCVDLLARLGGHTPKIAEQNKFWTDVFNTTLETATVAEISKKYHYLEKFVLDQKYFQSIEMEALNALRDAAISSIELRDFMRSKAGDDARQQSQRKQEQRSQSKGRQQEHAAQPPSGSYAVNWRRVLGVAANEQDWPTVQKAYRQKVKLAHPDRGGNAWLASRLGEAFALAKHELRPVC